jgi:UDP-glucuronate decarboxylase
MGHSVVALDDFSTGSRDNLRDLRDHGNFEFLDWDVTDPFDVDVDGIFNLACPASPVHYQQQPTKTTKTSILGAINSLELATKRGIPVLHASSSEVYGDPHVSPQVEGYWGNVNPIGIRACYDEGKRAAETLFTDYRREFSTDIRIARIFNTYGPRMALDDGRVIPQFVTQALVGEPLTVYGDGRQTRSFCYVDDLVSGLIALFFQSDEHRPVNLGNRTPITVLQLAHEIIQMTKSSSDVVYLPLPEDDPEIREPNIQRASESLSWTPLIDRAEGLHATIADIQSRM